MMEDIGADVVGLNCYRGPKMTMKFLEKIRIKFHVMLQDSQFLIEQLRKNQVF
jgi:methionine synthase I (cobalamin-dependent)